MNMYLNTKKIKLKGEYRLKTLFKKYLCYLSFEPNKYSNGTL